MKKGILHPFLISLITGTLIFTLQSDQTEGCYYDGYENYFFDGIFESSIIKEPNLEPFFLPGYFKEDKNSSLSQTQPFMMRFFIFKK